MDLSFTKVGFGAALLASLAYAQTASPPAASAIVSPATESSDIKPEPVSATPSADADPESFADPASLLPDLPRVPPAKATLIGGTIAKVDRVRDQLTVKAFGGGTFKILFDPRTHIYRSGVEATSSDLREGDRIYLDTILDGTTVFARSIRLKSTLTVGESQGIVLKYRPERGDLTIRDAISPTPVRVRLDSSTRFLHGDRTVAPNMLTEGSLVTVSFGSEGKGRDVAREISILALPGTAYTFAGQIVHLDLRTGLIVLNSSTDHKTYEIYLDPAAAPDENLHIGAVVTVVTHFEGSRYVARNIGINSQDK